MRFAFVTYYWRPYRSGLTLHAARIAEALVAAGAEVEVVAARHDRALAAREVVRGVDVRRLRVAGRYDRGVLVPGLVPAYARAARRADVAVIVMPVAEAAALAAVAPRGRTAALYVCDPSLPAGRVLAGLVIGAVDRSAARALRRSALISVLSREYAETSRVLGPLADRVTVVEPIVPAEPFRRFEGAPPSAWALAGPPTRRVGYLGRLAREKGLDRLIRAAERMAGPVQVVLAGDSDGVAGGGERARLEDLARSLGVELRVLGPLPAADLPAFYSSLDVFALPSVDRLEAWGMVQAEAMLCGTPVVASDLPGVRDVVAATRMGLTVPPGDVAALATALELVVSDPARYRGSRDEVVAALDLETTAARHVAALTALAR